MILNSERKKAAKLFKNWCGTEAEMFSALPQSGSDRRYYRISGGGLSAIAAVNSDLKENAAFLSFAQHFRKYGLPVPEIYGADVNAGIYLQQDFGDVSLFGLLTKNNREHSHLAADVYKKALALLPKFQVEAGNTLDYSVCYPRAEFDRQSMQWDLNYFKYYFLKLAKIQFAEQQLENDFESLINFLLEADGNYFMYRDFQARNIMLVDGEPCFIDFQGGRRGPLQYDIASLLYQTKAQLSEDLRSELLDYYLCELRKYTKIEHTHFIMHFHGFILIRLLQTMGAYGFRGFYERKQHFLQSIPFAQAAIRESLPKFEFLNGTHELRKILNRIIDSQEISDYGAVVQTEKLTVRITSFAYKNGVPYDRSGNGGGFVFDCRSIHNPGRYEEYKQLTGKNGSVIAFIEQNSGAAEYLENVYSLIDSAIEDYASRNFSHLMVNFGCTGGQHRSVYCAEKLAARLKTNSRCDVELTHTELEKRGL